MKRFVTILLLASAACGGESESEGPPLPWPADRLPTTPEPDDNRMSLAKAELGRILFYDPILSSDGQVACATCHSEHWGMSDGLARSVGVGGVGPAGPGREGPNVTRRNALTLWNVAFRERLFVDGRAGTLEEQVLLPLHDAIELGRPPEDVVADLAAIDEYAARFAEAFPESAEAVTTHHLQMAIAAFERTLRSDRAPYDRYVAGDVGALSEASVRGMFLFAELGCSDCHVPPRFESERYADRGIVSDPALADRGREEFTHDPADRGRFRVPTLRNIRETAPYFHDGSVASLDEAVALEAAKGPRALSADELADLLSFLRKGLIDPSRSPARPKSVPSGLSVPLDGFRIPR